MDIDRIVVRAIEAAFEDEQPAPRRRHSGLKAVAAGAALFAGARVAMSKGPGLPGLSTLSKTALARVPDAVRDRLDGLAGEEEEPVEDELPEDELPEDEELDEEPEAEFDEEDEEPEDDEPDDEEPEDEEPPEDPEAGAEEELPEEEEPDEDEPEAGPESGNGQRATPDVMQLMNPHSPPPVLAGARGSRGRRIRPAARPPSPPRRDSDKEEA